MNEVTRLTFLGFYLNGLLDGGETLSIDETRKHVSDGSLFAWLKKNFGVGVDLSLYGPDDEAAVAELFESLTNAVDARRKFMVEHNGLALLVAYCLEGIQQLYAR